MSRSHVLGALAFAMVQACAPEPEIGVEVFSSDTIPARFTVTVAGTLQMGLRADNFEMLPDKSLMMTTPAALVVQKGEGSADIILLKGSALSAQPIGTSPDSADALGVTGTKLRMTKKASSPVVTLSVEKP